MELELRWTPNRGQDKFIADDVHTHVHGAAMRCGLWTVKFWMSRDRYRELIIVGDLNIMHETSAKILQNSVELISRHTVYYMYTLSRLLNVKNTQSNCYLCSSDLLENMVISLSFSESHVQTFKQF